MNGSSSFLVMADRLTGARHDIRQFLLAMDLNEARCGHYLTMVDQMANDESVAYEDDEQRNEEAQCCQKQNIRDLGRFTSQPVKRAAGLKAFDDVLGPAK